MLVHSTLRQRDSAITVAEKVISRRTVGDHHRPAKAEEHPKTEIEANEDPSEDINETVPEDAAVAEEQLSRGKKTPVNPVKIQQLRSG